MKKRARFNLKRLVCCLALLAVLIACVSCDNGKENITEPEDMRLPPITICFIRLCVSRRQTARS